MKGRKIMCCPVCSSCEVRFRTRSRDYKCYSCHWTGKQPDSKESKFQLDKGAAVQISGTNQEVAQ
jgi:hypothetical protein